MEVKDMKTEELLRRINKVVDEQLEFLEEHPEMKMRFEPYPLDKELPVSPLLDWCEMDDCFDRLREILTYKYIIEVMNTGWLPVSMELLCACAVNMRKAGYVDEFYLRYFHGHAKDFYEAQGLKRKAMAHERQEILYEVKSDMEMEDPLVYETCVEQVRECRERLLPFVLYVMSEGCRRMEVDREFMKRDQYVLIEGALKMGAKQFAEDEECDATTRGCIHYFQYRYYDMTNRPALAERARAKYMSVAGRLDYEAECKRLLKVLPGLYRSEVEMVDFILNN